jgi:hypothetical protein
MSTVYDRTFFHWPRIGERPIIEFIDNLDKVSIEANEDLVRSRSQQSGPPLANFPNVNQETVDCLVQLCHVGWQIVD